MRYFPLTLLALFLMSTAAQAGEPQSDTHVTETEKAMVVGISPMMDAEGYFGTFLWAGPMWGKEISKKVWLMANPYGKFSPDSGYWGLGVTTTFEWMLGEYVGIDLLFEVGHEQHLDDFRGASVGLGAGPGITFYPCDSLFVGLYGTVNWNLMEMSANANPGLALGFTL
jgi:hypothetical protein